MDRHIHILGKPETSKIIVEMVPSDLGVGNYDVHVNTEEFPLGVPVAVQALLQAAIFLIPQAFQGIAEAAVTELLKTQKEQRNGEE